jgi:hypothetical protein
LHSSEGAQEIVNPEKLPSPDKDSVQNELTLRLDERIKQISEEYNYLLIQARKEAIEEERPSQEISVYNRQDSVPQASESEEQTQPLQTKESDEVEIEHEGN